MSGPARHTNFTLKTIARNIPASIAAHRFAALQRSGQYSELRFIQRGKSAFNIVGYKWPDKGARRKWNIGRARINPESKFTPEHLNKLREEYSRLKTVPISALAKFREMFSAMTDTQIKQLAGAGIKFVSKLAINEQARRKSAGHNPTESKGPTNNQVKFGSRGKTKIGWINSETPKYYKITYKSGSTTKTVTRRKDKVKFVKSGKYGKVIKNRCPKMSNPSITDAVKRAVELSRKFYGFAPRKLRQVNIEWPTALVFIGAGAQVDYVADKFDGKTRQYYHRFEGPTEVFASDRPQKDGSNLLIIRGKFKIKKEGITG